MGVAHPTAETVACPGQTLEIRWVCRGPSPPLLRVELELAPGPRIGGSALIEDEFLVSRRVVAAKVNGSKGSVDWVVPPDANGSNSQAWWRLCLYPGREDDDVVDGAPAGSPGKSQPPLCVSEKFSIAKSAELLSYGYVPDEALRPARADVEVSYALLQVVDERRATFLDESLVRRWDTCAVCAACSEVYGDLAARRARWLAPAHAKRRRHAQDEAVLALKERDALGVEVGSHDARRARHAAKRRERREVMKALAAPKPGRERRKAADVRRDADLERASAFESTSTMFDGNLPRVAGPASSRPSPFVRNMPGAAKSLREDTRLAGVGDGSRREELFRAGWEPNASRRFVSVPRGRSKSRRRDRARQRSRGVSRRLALGISARRGRPQRLPSARAFGPAR